MAYTPSLDDIPSSGGYTPSLDDINELNNNSSAIPDDAATARGVLRLGQNLLSSTASVGQDFHNLPYNVANFISPKLASYMPSPTNINFDPVFGINNPTLLDKATQLPVKIAPYIYGGGIADLAKAPEFIGALTENAPALAQKAANVAGILGKNTAFGTGAAIATGTNPVVGGLAGLGGGILGEGINTAVNAYRQPENILLNYLNKSAQNSGALSPQEAADNLATNYTNAQGQPMGADIGTLTNNQALKNIYGALKYMPFSGVSKNMNVLGKQLSDNEISGLQSQLDAINNDKTIPGLQNQLDTINGQQQDYTQAINQAPNFLNNLASSLDDRTNLTSSLKDSVSQIFKNNRATSAENYAPINDSSLRLDKLGIDNLFPNYADATNELLAKRENLNNLFNDDNDLSSKLNNEIDKAQGMISNTPNYGITLPETVDRIKNLGQLSASANSQGKRYEGMLLGKMQQGLQTDLDNALRQSNNGDLADQLQTANDYHKNNVIPFYQNNEIRKAVTSNYIPAQAKLAKALHDPNNQSILTQMPNDAQNVALYQLMTGGKGTSSGLSNMSAEDIGNAYAKLPVDTKTAIAQYNPQADKYFENLPAILSKNDEIETTKGNLSDQIDKLSNAQQKSVAKLQAQLNTAKQNKYGVSGATSPTADKVAQGIRMGATGLPAALAAFSPAVGGIAGALTLPAALIGRRLASAMVNPDLINAYIRGGALPRLARPINTSFTGGIAGIPAQLNNQ